jgi:ADP-ribosylglycohydrolase
MLLELAAADGFGFAFEMHSAAFVKKHNSIAKYIAKRSSKTNYTDDTQMTLGIAEALLESDEWTPLFVAEKFVRAFRRDPQRGYARGFKALLKSVHDGQELLDAIVPFSERNGAAMRACPIGLLPSIGEILRKCRIQSAVTHNTVAGMESGMAASLLTHFFAYKLGKRDEAGDFVASFVHGPWTEPWEGKVGCNGTETVQAAITAIMASKTLCKVIENSVAFTGDTDSVATVAMGAAFHCDEIEDDLPQALLDGLEDGMYGKDYLSALDIELEAKFGIKCGRRK